MTSSPSGSMDARLLTFTPAEGKRLIALGLARYAPVRDRIRQGILLITRGGTNRYVAETLLGLRIPRGDFLLGRIQPEGSPHVAADGPMTPEMIINDGHYAPGVSFEAGLRSMAEGDIVFKGANLVNHRDGRAAVLVGHPTGGTAGMILPYVKERKIRLIVPVGLEKETSQDLDALEHFTRAARARGAQTPWVMALPGEPFTEIEALRQFAEVTVRRVAAGGIAGAEGAVTLLVAGRPEEVEKAVQAAASVHGEPPY